MASHGRRLASNAAGDFFVDSTCIDCATCRWIAPESFDEAGGRSRVYFQPRTDAQVHRARMALIACPVAAIGAVEKHDLARARGSFPERIDDNVHHCGYHAESSYGAASYLIVRPQGNVLVDSPRFAGPLAKRIEELGGVKLMFLTHRDDVADHRKYRERFGCERILHCADASRGTHDVEIQPEGFEPMALDEEITLVPVPGHTRGSMCLLYRGKFLFTGDHMAWDPQRDRAVARREVCWYDWDRQIESMRALAAHHFEWILPGHGRRGRLAAEAMKEEVMRCAERMARRARTVA